MDDEGITSGNGETASSGGKSDALSSKLASLWVRRRRHIVFKAFGEAVGIGAIPVIAALVLAKLRPWQFDLTLYALALGAVVALAWLILRGIVVRVRIVECSKDADEAFDLKDRLTSALYLRGAAGQDPYVRALMRDAEEKCARVDPRVVYPWRTPKSWRWSGAGVLCTFAVFLIPYLGWFESKDDAVERENLAAAGKRLIRLAKEVEGRKQSLETLKKNELPEKLGKLGEKLTLGKFEKGKALEELNKLTDELKKTQANLKDPVKDQFMSDLSRKLMSQDSTQSLGKDMKKGGLKPLTEELERMKERLEKGELTDEELDALDNLARSLKESFESNPELAESFDKEAIERALKSLAENIAKERELRKEQQSILDQLKEACERFNGGLGEQGLSKEAESVEESLSKLTEGFKQNGKVDNESISEMRQAVEQANEAMQQSGASALEKRIASDRMGEINALLDKLEKKCDESGG
jgi:hypothetical protein